MAGKKSGRCRIKDGCPERKAPARKHIKRKSSFTLLRWGKGPEEVEEKKKRIPTVVRLKSMGKKGIIHLI